MTQYFYLSPRVLLVVGLALGGCSKSYDQGSESPEEASFTEDAPSWDNGISDSSFFDDSTSAGLAYDRIFATTDNSMTPTWG